MTVHQLFDRSFQNLVCVCGVTKASDPLWGEFVWQPLLYPERLKIQNSFIGHSSIYLRNCELLRQKNCLIISTKHVNLPTMVLRQNSCAAWPLSMTSGWLGSLGEDATPSAILKLCQVACAPTLAHFNLPLFRGGVTHRHKMCLDL